MNAAKTATTLTLRIMEPVVARNINNTHGTKRLLPQIIAAFSVKDIDKIPWLVIDIGTEQYGWSQRALRRLLEDDAVRMYTNGKEVGSLEVL